MPANLRDRLKRIQEQKKSEAAHKKNENIPSFDDSALKDRGWKNCGFQVMKREVKVDLQCSLVFNSSLPRALAILVPDLAKREPAAVKDFVFFDLETTGLSGGAGTLAFLAAFGRLVEGGKLRISQYLLLDYPGENDFLDAVLAEFQNEKSVIVSYNGKCFDSQILKTRCLMNRIIPPVYFHADLLHPSRRLWKTVIGDCSQQSVETRILGLCRENDVPGSLAPEIWFEFLKTGKIGRLSGICDHNLNDIAGLFSIFAAIVKIARDPLGCGEPVFDLERLALFWRNFLRRGVSAKELQITGGELLRRAAEKKCPRACLVYAQDKMRNGEYKEAVELLVKIAESDFTPNIKLTALRSLAIDSERRLKNIELSICYVKRALALAAEDRWKSEFENRKERLEKKFKRESAPSS